MSEDRYRNLRELPFDVVAGALGIDLSKFKPRKGGTEWAGNCPIHQPKRNGTAFSYSQDGKFNCFSCGQKGRGAIDLCMKVRGVGFAEAVNILTPYAAGAIAREAKRPVIKQVQEALVSENQPFKGTYDKFKVESAWLKERGLEPATLERYGVFEYQNNSRKSVYNGSVMLKISRHSDGECVGYLSRNIGEVIPEKPKYRFPEGLHKSLEVFGAWQLKQAGTVFRILYVVESPFAVMAFHQKGMPAVSLFGWSVSPQQADIISQLAKGVVYLCDRDKYGQCASAVHELAKRLWVKAPEMPEGVDDPEQLTLEQIKSLT